MVNNYEIFIIRILYPNFFKKNPDIFEYLFNLRSSIFFSFLNNKYINM